MKAEKTREVINRWYAQQVYRTKKFETKAFAMQLEEKTLDELAELERLAKIGRYTEMAFEDDNALIITEVMPGGNCTAIDSIEELIEWGEEQECGE